MAKLRERISVSKRARRKFYVERFNLKKLDVVEVEKKYQVEISNRFAVLESLDESLTSIMLGKISEKISKPQQKIL
jgi:hypothetical protein